MREINKREVLRRYTEKEKTKIKTKSQSSLPCCQKTWCERIQSWIRKGLGCEMDMWCLASSVIITL